MRAVIQRVRSAKVEVSGRTVGEIGAGLLVLLGVGQGDTLDATQKLAKKITQLRIFEDAHGKMNLSLQEMGGACLVVSQFTLLADCSNGRRPFFGGAEEPSRAAELCREFIKAVSELGIAVASGEFGATMQVSLCNDGPVTIILEA